jgi:8-oxo-dGTP pyrophosphatase MutT (NUDIX family)
MTEVPKGKETTEKLEIHPAATVFIISTEEIPRILLLKHRKLGVWVPPGGHQEINETPIETAIKEVFEETGLDASGYLPKPKRLSDGTELQPVPNFILLENIPEFGDKPAHQHQDMIFVIRMPFQEPVRSERESEDIGWFTRSQVEQMETFGNVRYLLADIFGDGFDESEE